MSEYLKNSQVFFYNPQAWMICP